MNLVLKKEQMVNIQNDLGETGAQWIGFFSFFLIGNFLSGPGLLTYQSCYGVMTQATIFKGDTDSSSSTDIFPVEITQQLIQVT